jgi:hypothetical protein
MSGTARLPTTLLTALLALLPLALVACSVDPGVNPAYGCEGCQGTCVMGFCVADEDDGMSDAGSLDGGGAGTGAAGSTPPPPPEACDEPGATEFCYEGPEATATTGTCKAGMRVCGDGFWGSCFGQVVPQSEECNREDDDCDGEIDEEVELGTCSTGQPGACDVGMLRCETGIAVCGRTTDPGAEDCNGDDDDCDGNVDEGISSVCYPAAPDGCSDDGEGGFECLGICQPGVSSCVDGVAAPCDGAVEPITEECGSNGPAQDEDCDGMADNGCTCGAGDSQECYSGPEGTLDVGVCMAGDQVCDTSIMMFGECMGEVLPGVEDCSNQGSDDDCNATDDDIRGRGDPCTVPNVEGVCRDGWFDCNDDTAGGELECIGPSATAEVCNSLDDDCDGRTDEEVLGTATDCSECGDSCEDGDDCCSGRCTNIADDPLHCGRCGNDCGERIVCCSGDCANLESDPNHCGECGKTCGLGGCCSGMCPGLGDPICL